MTDDNNDLFASLPSLSGDNRIDTLSHYTSLDGFLGIIKEHQLRASNILYLNDRQEMVYGVTMANDVMKEIIKRNEQAGVKAAEFKIPSTNEPPDTYACCFCEETDMLSQWRGYGSATQSVSIQFDFARLVALAADNQVELKKVIYGRKQVMDEFHKVLGKFNGNIPMMNLMSRVLNLDMESARRDAIYDLSPQFKNQSFSEEREWRIIVRAKSEKPVQYRVRDNVIMPYVNVMAPNGLPITKVTIGPGKEAKLTQRSIENFLRNQPRYADVKVVVSAIPFRT